MTLTIEPATDADTDAIADIYNHYILTSVATFEEEALGVEEMGRRIDRVRATSLPWLVAREPHVVGYCYARPWRERAAYRFSVETSVYVASAARRRGIGRELYQRLLHQLRAKGVRSVIGGISLPNPASIALHEKLGFTKVAHFKSVGFKFNEWIDVGYWQLRWASSTA